VARAAAAPAVAAVAVLAGVFPAVAAAHARFVRSTPADGAVLAKAPSEIRVGFDDVVQVAAGNEAIRNGGGTVLAGKPRVEGGRTLVLPLHAGLGEGDYSVRWSILSDDGHREQGVLAFGVGAGRSPPTSALTASSSLDVSGAIARTLWLLGVLLAAGTAVFALVVRTAPESRTLFAGFLLTFLGASSLGHDVSGTRLGLVTQIAATIALVGGALAALMPVERRLRWPALAAALALLPLPTLGGHALDPGRPRILAVAFDIVHLAAAASWFGGLVVLASHRRAPAVTVRRFSQLALVSVAALGLAGIGSALIELTALRQLWSTGYGQAILVKTGLFSVAIALGWVNRTRLLDAFSRLRRSMAIELVLLLGVVTAAGVLTELKPGRSNARAAVRNVERHTAPIPPPGVVTLAHQAGAVAVALTLGQQPTVTLVGPDAGAYETPSVRVGEAEATACGPGCWRTGPVRPGVVVVRASGLPTVRFTIPRDPRPAASIVRDAAAAFRGARSVSVAEALASGPSAPQRSEQRAEAPDRFSYRIASGPQGIVIGNRRWDRPGPRAAWVRATQRPPLRMPAPLWDSRSRNAFVVAENRRTWTVALFDPALTAWFELRVDRRTYLPHGLRMTAPSHFMTDRYSRYDTPREVLPPG
jgi:copper transport protein